ncbi:unnamed protein product, partial [Ixodes pacificus]
SLRWVSTNSGNSLSRKQAREVPPSTDTSFLTVLWADWRTGWALWLSALSRGRAKGLHETASVHALLVRPLLVGTCDRVRSLSSEAVCRNLSAKKGCFCGSKSWLTVAFTLFSARTEAEAGEVACRRRSRHAAARPSHTGLGWLGWDRARSTALSRRPTRGSTPSPGTP